MFSRFARWLGYERLHHDNHPRRYASRRPTSITLDGSIGSTIDDEELVEAELQIYRSNMQYVTLGGVESADPIQLYQSASQPTGDATQPVASTSRLEEDAPQASSSRTADGAHGAAHTGNSRAVKRENRSPSLPRSSFHAALEAIQPLTLLTGPSRAHTAHTERQAALHRAMQAIADRSTADPQPLPPRASVPSAPFGIDVDAPLYTGRMAVNNLPMKDSVVVAYLNEGPRVTRSTVSLKRGRLGGNPVTYINKSWPLPELKTEFCTELLMYKTKLRNLQGLDVPAIINVYPTTGRLQIAMEPPHPVFWTEASADMPYVLKHKCIRAYERIHAAGLLHGDVKLQHMLIGADASVKIIDFSQSRSLRPNFRLRIEKAEKQDMRMEMRKVCFLLDANGARERERARVNDPAPAPVEEWAQLLTNAPPKVFVMPGITADGLQQEAERFATLVERLEGGPEREISRGLQRNHSESSGIFGPAKRPRSGHKITKSEDPPHGAFAGLEIKADAVKDEDADYANCLVGFQGEEDRKSGILSGGHVSADSATASRQAGAHDNQHRMSGKRKRDTDEVDPDLIIRDGGVKSARRDSTSRW